MGFLFWGGKTRKLVRASGEGDVDRVRALLSRGADVNGRDREGFTPLLSACARGSVQTVAALLGGGADPNLAGDEGETPLSFARGSAEITAALLKAGASPGEEDLELAAFTGDRDVCRLLAEAVAGKERVFDRALLSACSAGHLAIAEDLLVAGADPTRTDDEGMSPLGLLMREAHSWPARQQFAALAESQTGTGFGGLASMFEGIADIARATESGALVPVPEGFLDLVRSLLAHGADVNAVDMRGDAALHIAVRQRLDDSVVELLLSRGADPAMANARGRSPRDEAAEHPSDVVRALLAPRRESGR